MDKKEAKKRIEKLKKVIKYHRYLYHVLDKQKISDAALDSLKKELSDLEEKYPQFKTTDSPTQRIAGEPLEKFEKKEHSVPMLSFNDAFSEEEVRQWEKRIKKLTTEKLDYFCEAKIDGLAVALIYEKGLFERGLTRGNGKIGEDVSENLKTIESIPISLEKEIDCEVRGEVFISKKEFKKINQKRKKQGLPLYANPRNLAAGSVRQLDPKIASERNLSFLAWQLLNRKEQKQEKKELLELGFKSAQGKYCPTLEDVFQYYEQMRKKREDLPYEVDGIVVGLNDNDLFKELGVAGKAPRAAIAFKFPGKEATTIVKSVKVQVGRTGNITPVACLKPVRLGGVIVSRATLHNADEIKRLGLKIGDTVIVERAGDVIPRVKKVLKNLRTGKEKAFTMPTKCPVCKTKLSKKETILRCPNKLCEKRQRRQLYHFVNKNTFDIENLGPKIIDQLVDKGLVSQPSDIFDLKQGDLLPLERFAEKSSKNIIESIEKSKEISFSRFIFALGIRGVGEETARDLALHFSDIKSLTKAKREELLEIQDIGPETADCVHDFFKDKRNLNLIKDLLKKGVKIKKEKQKGKLKGKTFVFTGKLSFERDRAKQRVRELGGNVSSSVSEKTDFVVLGKEPGAKFKKAKELKLKIIKEQEFKKLIQ